MSDRDQAAVGVSQRPPGEMDGGRVAEQGSAESERQAAEAEALACAHYAIEPGLRAVYRLEGPDPNGPRIKLLEVNEQTVAVGIVPVGFAAHPTSGLHYPSVVIEVTPQEYEAIQHKQLSLPAGWEICGSYERPTGTGCADDAP